jgi:hypothetical protein
VSVYFVTCREANAVKIGSSLEPHARLHEIQRGCPLELRLEAVLPGGHEEEFALHARFADIRLHGEWFTINEMIEAIIAVNPVSPPPENALKHRGVKAAERRRLRAERMRKETVESAHRDSMRYLKMRKDIHFPFREPAEAES